MTQVRYGYDSPEFNYHLLRSALDGFKKNLSELNPEEYRHVYSKATKTFDLETLVLTSQEAQGLVIPEDQLDRSLAEVSSRYNGLDEFIKDLKTNQLDELTLRRALRRELMFDVVMQRVAAKSADVSELDMRLFYEMHRERFETPERRKARHILITINPSYMENTREAARARLEHLKDKLAGRINRFSDYAKRYSECPTAMQGGQLGQVQCGQLYPELDTVLFSLEVNLLSPIVETEIGFHLLLCEKIKPGRRIAFTKVAPTIRELLRDRQQRNCQKSWLAELKQNQVKAAI